MKALISRWTTLMTIGAIALTIGSISRADAIDDSFELAEPDRLESFEKLDHNVDTLAIDSELAEADTIAYEDITQTSSKEAKALQGEIKSLEKQVRNLKSGAERAKAKALLAQKRLDLQKQNQKDAQTRLAKAEALKRKEEKSLMKIQERVKATEERLAAAKQKTRSTQDAIKAAHQERAELERRLKKATAQIEREKAKHKSLKEKRSIVNEYNRRLKSKVGAAERRAPGNS